MHAVSGDVPVARSVLPEGEAGVDATVKEMARLANSEWGSKSSKIRALAMNIINKARVPQKDYYGEIVAIHNWVKNPLNIRYFRDPVGQETLADPEQTAFNLKGGDCDDKTVLEMALLGSVGIQSYPVVVGQVPGSYCHVYLHAMVPPGKHRNANKVVPLDPIMPQWPAGVEAKNVKAKKTYPELSNPLGLQGNAMGALGAYAVGPSYLDQNESHASELLVPDAKACYTYEDGTVNNSTRATQPQEGIDAMMGMGLGSVDNPNLPPTGGYFTSTSAGTDGTINRSDGQLVPRGFLRNDPSIPEIMAMRPASASDLGPRGPIYARRASQETGMMPRIGNSPVPSLSKRLAAGGLPVATTPQTVGLKRYDVPAVQQQLEKKNLTGPHYRNEFLKGQKIVTAKPMNIERLGKQAMPVSIGEELADYEYTHRQICGMLGSLTNLMTTKRLPLAQSDKAMKEAKGLITERDKLERKILEMRQKMRGGAGVVPRGGVRSAAVLAQIPTTVLNRDTMLRPANSVTSVSGLGGIMDTISSPFVYVPALALVGIAAFKLFRGKRR